MIKKLYTDIVSKIELNLKKEEQHFRCPTCAHHFNKKVRLKYFQRAVLCIKCKDDYAVPMKKLEKKVEKEAA